MQSVKFIGTHNSLDEDIKHILAVAARIQHFKTAYHTQSMAQTPQKHCELECWLGKGSLGHILIYAPSAVKVFREPLVLLI